MQNPQMNKSKNIVMKFQILALSLSKNNNCVMPLVESTLQAVSLRAEESLDVSCSTKKGRK
jgi:hypothetical protein